MCIDCGCTIPRINACMRFCCLLIKTLFTHEQFKYSHAFKIELTCPGSNERPQIRIRGLKCFFVPSCCVNHSCLIIWKVNFDSMPLTNKFWLIKPRKKITLVHKQFLMYITDGCVFQSAPHILSTYCKLLSRTKIALQLHSMVGYCFLFHPP